jgi:hypothetical protein
MPTDKEKDMTREDQFIPHLVVSNGPAAIHFTKTCLVPKKDTG